MKEKIRPIYSELQGYLSQTPPANNPNEYLRDKDFWDQYNNTINELNEITGEDYNKFKIKENNNGMINFIYLSTLRNKLGGLISYLHGKYFNDELPPFSGMPSTIIQQNQQQSQNVNVQILLEIQSIIDKKLNQVTDEKEKGFLEKIKESLSSVKNISELINLILSTGVSMGLAADQILKLFKL